MEGAGRILPPRRPEISSVVSYRIAVESDVAADRAYRLCGLAAMLSGSPI